MKRLKYRHPFYGKSIPVILSMFAAFFVIIVMMSVILDNIENESCYIYILIGSIAIILLTLVIDYAVIHHLNPDEKRKIAESNPPEWKRFPDSMKEAFQTDKRAVPFYCAVMLALELVIAFFILLGKDVQTMLVTLAVIVPVTIIIFVCIAIWEYIWANMDDSAIYTRIEVDHYFKGEKRRTGGREIYIVFYLPDGKYVLEKTGCTIPKNIVVIKYKCFIRWENADIFI